MGVCVHGCVSEWVCVGVSGCKCGCGVLTPAAKHANVA